MISPSVLIEWNQRLQNVDNFELGIRHYESIVADVEKRERKLLKEIGAAKQRILKSIEVGHKLKTLKEHFGQIIEALDEDFGFEEVLEEAHVVLSDATGLVSTRDNFSQTLDKIRSMVDQMRQIKLKPSESLITLGTLSGTKPIDLKTPRRGRGRGRLIKQKEEPVGYEPSLASTASDDKQFEDYCSIEAEPPTAGNLDVLSLCSEDSFSQKVVRPDLSPVSNKIANIDIGKFVSAKPFNPFPDQNVEDKATSFVLANETYHLQQVEDCHGDLNKPMGISATSTSEFIVADTFNNTVHIHDQNLKRVATLRPSQGFSSPSSIACTKNGDTYIKDDVAIHLFVKQKYQKSFGQNIIGDKSAGVMLHKGEIRTIINGHRIACFSLEGEHKSTIPINWQGSVVQRPRIRFARNHKDTLYLACMANNQVLITDNQGNIKYIAGRGYGRAPDEFTQPAGLSIDSVGNFIVGDSKNHRFLHFSAQGEPRGQIKTNIPTKRPTDCYLTDTGRFYTCLLNGTVHIFQLSTI